MRKLFISFEALLLTLQSGETTERDLATGLFFFDPRETDGVNEVLFRFYFYADCPETAHAVHGQVVAALAKGNEERRVFWCEWSSESHTYDSFNRLLVKKGFREICNLYKNPENDHDPCFDHDEIAQEIEDAGNQLEVIH
jgi:hypothetical protein